MQLLATLSQAISSSDVTSVVVTVTASDMQPRTASLVKTQGQWSGTLGKLPAGTGRTFSAEAFNSSGTKLYAGTATPVTILPRQTTAVSITLQEVNPAPPFQNEAPVITSLSAAPGTVEPGGVVTLSASASDANGDTLTYAWTAPSGTFGQASSLNTTWTAGASAATVPLTLTVTDLKGTQSKVAFNITVNNGKGDSTVNASLNTWPQVSGISATATALELNESTTVSATASDNDGDTLAYRWTASCPGSWTGATSASATFTPTALPSSSTCNNCALTVTVTDSRNNQAAGGQTTGILSLCVGPKKTATFPPDITETFQSASSTSANGTVTFRVKAVDPQGSAMSFSWTSNLGTRGTPTTTPDSSEVVWTAPSCTTAGSPTVTATVTNAYGLSASQAFSLSGLPACVTAGWASAGTMSRGRTYHTATLLPSGKVLIAGGSTNFAPTEVYDPVTQTVSSAGAMVTAREFHTATLLSSGKVLVTGGRGSSGTLASAELYDPATNSWSAAAPMAAARHFHTATRLSSGKVLVAGGEYRDLNYGNVKYLSSAEVYDPATDSWSAAAPMAKARVDHRDTLLPSGKVLVTGGDSSGFYNTVEVYDAATNSWSAAAPMAQERQLHTATLLPSGKVLVVGGLTSTPLASAEVYDPATNSWSSAGSRATASRDHAAALLPSGKVLVMGGGANGSYVTAAEVYDPATNSWSTTASMAIGRTYHTATVLPSGKVFVAGGYNVTALEAYTP